MPRHEEFYIYCIVQYVRIFYVYFLGAISHTIINTCIIELVIRMNNNQDPQLSARRETFFLDKF